VKSDCSLFSSVLDSTARCPQKDQGTSQRREARPNRQKGARDDADEGPLALLPSEVATRLRSEYARAVEILNEHEQTCVTDGRSFFDVDSRWSLIMTYWGYWLGCRVIKRLSGVSPSSRCRRG
jgi:hypothetical protein